MDSASVILSNDEIAEITGYRRISDQQKWFEEVGIPCYPRRDGLTVARRWFELAPLSKQKPEIVDMPSRGSAPNWSGLMGAK